jgi:outer membrane immunogenic protein
MKKLLLASMAGLALLAGSSANAADLSRRQPVYKAPPPVVAPIPVFSWTGCYLGGHIGGGWGRKTFDVGFADEDFAPFSVRDNTGGFLAGGQIGCDYQFALNWVIGIEGAASWADIKGTTALNFAGLLDNVPFTESASVHAKTDFLASVTGRLGYGWDRWLGYVKGGVAWAHDKYNISSTVVTPEPAWQESGTFAGSETRTGWTVGAGVEWAFLPNWSAKLEYDFYDFGTRNVLLPGTVNGDEGLEISSVDAHIKQQIHTVQFGINYRFGWGKGKAPVVARY